ncbi:hypothetical protein C481_17782 [Natrialba asiatica DSM 12278]|uniref:Uncharacterized protein n=1 Tax=Natrialba asiatica (strain ATCC 700177 / DSM 12278 / JCM 9576 / FERM P-10747 / NBRC 102637 / 172P1) TaxID=29540 RepID=M0AJ31_NATA1|nr:hypothetical protein C481_17782 [Natrialba asiatica DSM 12278]
MPSLEGLKTWFYYETRIIAFAVSLFIVLWAGNRITGSLDGLPLTSPRFGLAITAIWVGTILALLWLAGRYN